MKFVISLARLSFLSASVLLLSKACEASWQDLPASIANGDASTGSDTIPGRGGNVGPVPSVSPFALPILPTTALPGGPPASVDWTGLFRASGRFLAIEHAFRLLTEPGTREGLQGPFIQNYARALGGLHGWADGDEFYVNYVGHPMQGSVAGFLWVGNDRRYGRAEFGTSPEYWKGRLRAAGFAWVYSTQFEIGIFSEASIGAIQATPPQQGFVDHVITPTVGLGWMIAEDALDKYVIERVETATTNRWIRMLTRSGMNPSRTFANVLRGEAPWHRDTREGISAYRPLPREVTTAARRAPPPPEPLDSPGPPPFELNMGFHAERIGGGGKPVSCVGGGGTAAIRFAPAWQLVVDVGGCNLLGLERNVSGDSFVYMAGPRWTSSGVGPWTAHWQLLVGGNKMTEELMKPERKEFLEQLAVRQGATPPTHEQYTEHAEANGLAVATAAGVDYKLTRALAIRVAELSYRHSWAGPVWGRSYSDSLRLVTGLVLRMGTW
jgi:hypothetical protein